MPVLRYYLDVANDPHPISSMVTKICHHAAVVYVRAARW
jgi:hypothetical protein